MKLSNALKSFAVATAMLCASQANAQNVELATNLGFEDPIGMEGEDTPGQWNPFAGGDGGVFAAGAGTSTDAPLDGVTHGALTIDGTGNSFAGLQYRIDDITPGLEYTFSFSARSEGANLEGVDGELRFEFLDETGGFIGGQLVNNQPIDATDTYASFSQTRIAPTGATSLRAVIAIQSFGGGADGSDSDTGTLFVDGASIQGPPIGTEPPDPSEGPTPGPVMELAINPSFEDPIGELGDFLPGWNPFAGPDSLPEDSETTATVSTIAPLTESTHGLAQIRGDENAFAGFVQQIDNIVPGEDYTFSFSARSEGVDLEGINAEFRIEYVDAQGVFVIGQFANNAEIVATDTYTSFTQTNTAPLGAVNLRAVIAIQSFGGGADGSNSNNGALFIDDTSIIGSLIEDDVLKGDVDRNGMVEFADIPPFIQLLIDGIDQDEGDCDCNGEVEFADIPVFIQILIAAAAQ